MLLVSSMTTAISKEGLQFGFVTAANEKRKEKIMS